VDAGAARPFYLGMKSVFPLLLGFGSLVAHAAPQPQDAHRPAPPPPPAARVPDLREVLQQYHPGSAAAPRQLTPEERAELRRQLSISGQPASTTLSLPSRRKDP